MDKIKTVKIKLPDGSVSEETYTISVDAKDVDMKNGKDLQDTIGDINVDRDGSIAEQLGKYKDYDSDIETLYGDVDDLEAADTELENNIIDLQINKINKTDIVDNLESTSATKVLSANQGKVLGDAVAALDTDIKKKAYFFDTVAAMKAANLKEGDYACTLGYYTANDGGAAEYKITSTESQTDYQEELNNSFYATLLIFDNLIPKQFGAKGNGIDNDTTILQQIIDYANSTSYDIKLTKGTYLYTNLVIKENVNIFGDGEAILKLKDDTCVDSNTSYYLIVMQNGSSIKNIELDGNKNNNTSFRVADTVTVMGSNISVEKCHFYNVVDSAIMFSESINSILKDNRIDDARDCGIYCNNNNSNKIMNSLIINNFIKNATTSGIALKRGCRYIDIKDNYLLDCTYGITSEHANTSTDFSKEFTIIGNTIMSTEKKQIGIDTRGGYYCNIKNNRIYNYSQGIVVQGSHDVNVESNIIELYSTVALTSQSTGIFVVGRGVEGFNVAYNINILNNIIHTEYLENDTTHIYGCIRVNSTDVENNINIIGNSLTGNEYASGITFGSNVVDITVKDNHIDVGKNAIVTQGRNLIANNRVVNGTLTLNGASYFMQDAYDRRHFRNGSTSAPTQSGTTYRTGDIVYAKYGNGAVFAWMYDGSAFKPINF